jgi:hypothetical protein
MKDQGMENNNSGPDAVIAEPHSREDFSSTPLSLASQEQGWCLMRTFSTIGNPAIRDIILEMVSALAWQDSQDRSALAAHSGAKHEFRQ